MPALFIMKLPLAKVARWLRVRVVRVALGVCGLTPHHTSNHDSINKIWSPQWTLKFEVVARGLPSKVGLLLLQSPRVGMIQPFHAACVSCGFEVGLLFLLVPRLCVSGLGWLVCWWFRFCDSQF